MEKEYRGLRQNSANGVDFGKVFVADESGNLQGITPLQDILQEKFYVLLVLFCQERMRHRLAVSLAVHYH